MDAISLLSNRFKAQVNKFSGNLSNGLSKTKGRFFKEMLYGIQASKDVKLSNISRALQEDIALIKTENRLSRNLDDEDYTKHINDEILRFGKRHVTADMVIGIDPGDINKPYAKKMEYLCNIYDADKKVNARGYHLCQVTAANLEHNKVVPLYCEAYSTEDLQRSNATEKIINTINTVVEKIGLIGTWAIDRQGDNEKIISHFLDKELKFVTRLKLNRYLHHSYNRVSQVAAERLVRHVKQKYQNKIIKIEDGIEFEKIVTYSSIVIGFPNIPDKWFNAVIVEGFAEKPMVLVTNLGIEEENPFSIWRVVEAYLTRWKCDECFRYIKQSYNTEDVRVRNYKSIRNMIAFVHAIAYFTSIYMGVELKLKIMVGKILVLSKRFFGIPNFFNYAMADGIYNLLSKSRTGIINQDQNKSKPPDLQFALFPD